MAAVEPIQALSGLRAAVGTGAWLAPRMSGRMFGINPDRNPQAPYVARLFGVRDLALAVGANASSGEARSLWLRLGIACDVADALAGAIAGRRGQLHPLASGMVTVIALGAAAGGVAALQAEKD